MIRDENIYCLKLISNSCKKTNNNQITELCHKLNLLLEFLWMCVISIILEFGFHHLKILQEQL